MSPMTLLIAVTGTCPLCAPWALASMSPRSMRRITRTLSSPLIAMQRSIGSNSLTLNNVG